MAAISSATRIILITGASQGTGLAIARVLSTPAIYPNQNAIIGSRSLTKGKANISALLAEDATLSLSSVSIDLTSDDSISAASAAVVPNFLEIRCFHERRRDGNE